MKLTWPFLLEVAEARYYAVQMHLGNPTVDPG